MPRGLRKPRGFVAGNSPYGRTALTVAGGAVKLFSQNKNRIAIHLEIDPDSTSGASIVIANDGSLSSTSYISKIQPGDTFDTDDWSGDLYVRAIDANESLDWWDIRSDS